MNFDHKVAKQCLSKMQDGYAVIASDGPGEYVVAFAAHAGHQQPHLESGSVAYITTGQQSVRPKHLSLQSPSFSFCLVHCKAIYLQQCTSVLRQSLMLNSSHARFSKSVKHSAIAHVACILLSILLAFPAVYFAASNIEPIGIVRARFLVPARFLQLTSSTHAPCQAC